MRSSSSEAYHISRSSFPDYDALPAAFRRPRRSLVGLWKPECRAGDGFRGCRAASIIIYYLLHLLGGVGGDPFASHKREMLYNNINDNNSRREANSQGAR